MKILEGENNSNRALGCWSEKIGLNSTVFALAELVNTLNLAYNGYTQELQKKSVKKQVIATKLNRLNQKFKKDTIYLNYLYDITAINNLEYKTIQISQLIQNLNNTDNNLTISLESAKSKDLVLTDAIAFCKSTSYLFACFSTKNKLAIRLRRQKKLSLRFANTGNKKYSEDFIKLINNYNKKNQYINKNKLNIVVASLCIELLSSLNCGLYYNKSNGCIYIDIPLAKQMNVFE